MPDRITIGNFLLVLASIALMGALGGVFYGWHVSTAWTKFQGEVIDLIIERDGSGKEMAYPVFRFRNAVGLLQTNISSHGSAPPGYSVGEYVTILHESESTSEPQIADFQSLYGIAVICGALGAIGIVLGFTILRFPKWIPRQSQMSGPPG
jgi:membrane associated rhomboid family serine protease